MSSDEIKIVIGGRDYTLQPPFTNRELHLIKQIAGVRAGELFEALEARDTDLVVAIAHLAVRRKNVARPSLDELWDLPAGEITVEFPDEDETGDPTSAPERGASETDGSPETIPSPDGAPITDGSST